MFRSLILILLSALNPLCGNCQIIFNAASCIPVAGDSYTEFPADTTGVLPGPAGTNQIWDFQYLTVNTNNPINHLFSAPIPFSFPPCSVDYNTATIEDTSAKNYYFADSNSMVLLGSVPCYSGHKYTNDTIMKYPFSYGSSFQIQYFQQRCCSFMQGGGSVKRTYDGYGTLKLPGMTYTNVARLEEIDNYSRIYAGPGGSSSHGPSITYKWFTNDKFPVLTITTEKDSTIHSVTGGPSYWTTGERKFVFVQSYAGVGINDVKNNDVATILYSNPFSETIQVITQRKGLVSLYDYWGNKLLSETLQKELNINVKHFVSGMYIVKFESEDFVAVKKIVVIRQP